MNGKYILKDKKVVPVDDVLEWGKWFESADRAVKQETVNGLWVSTVFLGLDHGFGSNEPLVFETMVFSKDGKDLDDSYQMRCSTWEQAEKMHTKAVRWAKKQ